MLKNGLRTSGELGDLVESGTIFFHCCHPQCKCSVTLTPTVDIQKVLSGRVVCHEKKEGRNEG